MGMRPSELLEVHHKATVSRDSTNIFDFGKPVNTIGKFLFDFVRHVVVLTHLKSQPRHYSIEDIIGKGLRAVHITRSRWVVVIKADDSKSSISLMVFFVVLLCSLYSIQVNMACLAFSRLLYLLEGVLMVVFVGRSRRLAREQAAPSTSAGQDLQSSILQ